MKKNKLLLNEYLGDFMHFETIFFIFLWKMTFSNPITPLKYGKFTVQCNHENTLSISDSVKKMYKFETKTFPVFSWLTLRVHRGQVQVLCLFLEV